MISSEFTVLVNEYNASWEIAKISDSMRAQCQLVAETILESRPTYEDVEKVLGIPWFYVAAIHAREGRCDFNHQLFNGELWRKKTSIAPIGMGPWSSWLESTIACFKKVSVPTWKTSADLIGWTFYYLEAHNGFGYRQEHNMLSPYIYSGTQFYEKGKYAWDGYFDPDLIDKEVGCMAILKRIDQIAGPIF